MTKIGVQTIRNYVYTLEALHRKMTGNEMSVKLSNMLVFVFMDDTNIPKKDFILEQMPYITNLEAIKPHYPNIQTYKNIIKIFASIANRLNLPFHSDLLALLTIHTKEIDEKRQENIANGLIVDVSRNEVIKIMNKLPTLEYQLIFGLYTLFPARRLDWRLTKITYLDNYEDAYGYDKQFNYITIPHFKAIFNNYKTQKTYGQQVFDIEDSLLKDIILAYVYDNDLNEGDLLFKNKKKNMYDASDFSYHIKKILKCAYDADMSVIDLRCSWATWINKQQLSMIEKTKYASMMGHSFLEQQKYNKLT